MLQQWCTLHGYFDQISESDQSSRVTRLNKHLKSPLTKLALHFLEFALESMCKFNAVFQSSLLMLPAFKTEVKHLLKILLGRFLRADVIQKTNDITTLDLEDTTLQLPDEQLGIGHKTWAYIYKEEDYLDERIKTVFFNGVKSFYVAVAATFMKKFPFKDNLVNDVSFVMSENQSKVDVAAILQMARRFPIAVSPDKFDCLKAWFTI